MNMQSILYRWTARRGSTTPGLNRVPKRTEGIDLRGVFSFLDEPFSERWPASGTAPGSGAAGAAGAGRHAQQSG
jgi:hypothetical protein